MQRSDAALRRESVAGGGGVTERNGIAPEQAHDHRPPVGQARNAGKRSGYADGMTGYSSPAARRAAWISAGAMFPVLAFM